MLTLLNLLKLIAKKIAKKGKTGKFSNIDILKNCKIKTYLLTSNNFEVKVFKNPLKISFSMEL